MLNAAKAKYEFHSDNEIWIFPDGGTFEKLETQEFLIPPGFFSKNLKGSEEAEEELRSNGIVFYNGSSVKLDATQTRLTMTNTRSQLDLLEQLLGPMGAKSTGPLPDLTTAEGNIIPAKGGSS